MIFMKVQSSTGKYLKPPKTDATMTKKAKVTLFFRPTVLLDHTASQLVKTGNRLRLGAKFGSVFFLEQVFFEFFFIVEFFRKRTKREPVINPFRSLCFTIT